MSEETKPHDAPADEETVTASRSNLPPAVALGFVIIALLGVLIVMNLRGRFGPPVDSEEIRALKAEVAAAQTNLNARRVALGLPPIEGTGEPVEDVAARLKKDADTMVALAGSLQSTIVQKEAEIAAKTSKLLESEQGRQMLVAEIEKLRSQLGGALVNASELESLRSQRDGLAAEAARLRQELASKGEGVPREDYESMQRQLEEAIRARDFFESRVKELDAQLAKANLFASSEAELLPAAVELFRTLRKLEGKADSEIATAYSSLGVSIGANVLHTLNFATGSAGLNPADEERIRAMVGEVPDGDLVLCVGYASETGDVDNNRTLSSDRATAAAELFTSVKRPQQLVQAVYLGQTDRFSSRIPERNQIVELWRIRKKQQ
jgi:outer membrane protein OmpA-like peptidoglycan-associated protein